MIVGDNRSLEWLNQCKRYLTKKKAEIKKKTELEKEQTKSQF
jgi:hypothetical protein